MLIFFRKRTEPEPARKRKLKKAESRSPEPGARSLEPGPRTPEPWPEPAARERGHRAPPIFTTALDISTPSPHPLHDFYAHRSTHPHPSPPPPPRTHIYIYIHVTWNSVPRAPGSWLRAPALRAPALRAPQTCLRGAVRNRLSELNRSNPAT